ncbi:polymer-forming cytoskeletal protein [Dongia sp.]|jgi:cytoskeletal protein CcmA (bactofilin family)|uniref:bactofilin family protein n=1 Tax=Dongia sp. TaxID=1977262 RepID=UPI0035AEE7A1
MFSKVNKSGQPTTVHDSPRPSVKAGIPSIISADLRITGDLVCSGDVQIDGWVEGDIQSRNITIGEGATVQGGLQAESVRICGLVNGEVRADMVVLEKTARVTGDILHKSLAIEQGAYLEGMCRRTDTHPVSAVATTTVEPAKEVTKEPLEKKAATA